MSKKCLECGDSIQGRMDKKFCSDQCRSSYNNRLNSDSTNFMRNINNILRKNRRILASLNPNGKTKISKEELDSQGFRFSYYTNEYITKSGNVYHFCYDQGIMKLDNDKFAIVQRKKYVD